MEIKKLGITDLNRENTFIQLNTVKGFKYIDRAGELVNIFHDKKNNPPKFSMNLQGLIIENPCEHIVELKITPTMLWMKMQNNNSNFNMINEFLNKANTILKILDVDDLSRMGLRTNLVYEFKKENLSKNLLNSVITISDVEDSSLRLLLNLDNSKAVLNFSTVKNKDNNNSGLMFDIDIFKQNLKISDIKLNLEKFWEYVKNEDGVLKIINDIIGKYE